MPTMRLLPIPPNEAHRPEMGTIQRETSSSICVCGDGICDKLGEVLSLDEIFAVLRQDPQALVKYNGRHAHLKDGGILSVDVSFS